MSRLLQASSVTHLLQISKILNVSFEMCTGVQPAAGDVSKPARASTEGRKLPHHVFPGRVRVSRRY